jgi:HEPN domain-containing protein
MILDHASRSTGSVRGHRLSIPIKTRVDFQALAEVRLAEAKTLLDGGHWDGAYYLTGYAVELALKACIIKLVMATDAFLDRNFSKDCYTHDIEELVELAGLKSARDAAGATDPVLDRNWLITKDWTEQSRYHRIAESEARSLYNAVSDATSGVMSWIRKQY